MDDKLTNEELVALYQSGDSLAASQLLDKNAGMIHKLAKQRLSVVESFELEDLTQIASIHLLNAAQSFDPDRGFKFSTLAWRFVENGLKTDTRRDGVLNAPVAAKGDSDKLREQKQKAKSQVSLSLEYDDGREVFAVEDEKTQSPLTETLSQEDGNVLKWALSQIPERNRTIVTALSAGKTLEEVGRGLGISRERVRQISEPTKRVLKLLVEVKTYGQPIAYRFTQAEKEYMAMVGGQKTACAIAKILHRSHATVKSFAKYSRKVLPRPIYEWSDEDTRFCEANRGKGWVWCAEQIGITPQALRSKIRRLGIQNKWNELTDKPELIRVYKLGWTSGEMARHFGVTRETVRRHLGLLGFPPPGCNARFCNSQKRRNFARTLPHRKRLLQEKRAAILGFPGCVLPHALILNALSRLGASDKRVVAAECKRICQQHGWPAMCATEGSCIQHLCKMNKQGVLESSGAGNRLRKYSISKSLRKVG